MRVASRVELDDAHRAGLVKLAHSNTTEVRLARRAGIVLLAADGLDNGEIAELMGIGRIQVGRWRERYVQDGLKAIEMDLPRGGRKPTVDAAEIIAANTHPDHDTLCAFRRRFLPQLEALFVQVLKIARQMKLLKLGTIALDGTKVHANASRHSALSYKRSGEIEVHLKAEIAELLERAERADVQESRAPLDIPAELARREARLEAIAQAKVEIERRAAERHAQEQQQYEAKLAQREDKAQRKGKRPGERPPAPPSGGVHPSDQVNLTDPESRISRARAAGASSRVTTARRPWIPTRCSSWPQTW